MKAFENRVPFAVSARQIAPLRSGFGNPKNSFEKAAAVSTSPETDFGTGF
jgi:hypothetical protein